MQKTNSSSQWHYLHEATKQIRNHPHLQQRNLKVAAHNGKLLLHGEVPSYFEKQMAQEALRQFDEWVVVENAIEVLWADC